MGAGMLFVLLSWFLFVPAQVRGIQDHCRHPVGNAIMNLRRKDVVLAAGKKVERAGVRPVVRVESIASDRSPFAVA